jgi:hypothetical protein
MYQITENLVLGSQGYMALNNLELDFHTEVKDEWNKFIIGKRYASQLPKCFEEGRFFSATRRIE